MPSSGNGFGRSGRSGQSGQSGCLGCAAESSAPGMAEQAEQACAFMAHRRWRGRALHTAHGVGHGPAPLLAAPCGRAEKPALSAQIGLHGDRNAPAVGLVHAGDESRRQPAGSLQVAGIDGCWGRLRVAPRPSRRHAHSLRPGSGPEDRAAASQTQAQACALLNADAGVAGAGPGSAPQEAPWLAAPGSHKPSGIPVTCFGKALPAFPRQLARSPGRTVQPLRSGVLSSLSCASCLLGRCWLLCWPGSLQGESLQGGQVCRRWCLCRFGSFRSSWLPCRMALSRLRFAFLQDMAAQRWTRPRRGSGPCPAGSLKAAACCPLWGRLARSCPRSPQAGQTR